MTLFSLMVNKYLVIFYHGAGTQPAGTEDPAMNDGQGRTGQIKGVVTQTPI